MLFSFIPSLSTGDLQKVSAKNKTLTLKEQSTLDLALNNKGTVEESSIKLLGFQRDILMKCEIIERNMYDYNQETSNILHKKSSRLGILSIPKISNVYAIFLSMIIRNRMNWNLDESHISKIYKSMCPFYIDDIEEVILKRVNSNLIITSDNNLKNWITELKKTDLDYFIINSEKSFNVLFDNQAYLYNKDIILITHKRPLVRLMNISSCIIWKRIFFEKLDDIHIPYSDTMLNSGFCWMHTNNIEKCYTRLKKKKDYNSIIVQNFKTFKDFETYFRPFIVNYSYEDINCTIDTEPEFKYYFVYNPDNDISVSKLINCIDNKYIVKMLNLETSDNFIDSSRNDSLMCCICHETSNIPLMEKNCNSIFCCKCIYTWLSNHDTCPCCRESISYTDFISEDYDINIYVNSVDIISDYINLNTQNNFRYVIVVKESTLLEFTSKLSEKEIRFLHKDILKKKDIRDFKYDTNVLIVTENTNLDLIEVQHVTHLFFSYFDSNVIKTTIDAINSYDFQKNQFLVGCCIQIN